MALEKFPHPAGRICGCLLIVFQPVTEHDPTGLQVRVVETVVRTGIDDLLDLRPLGAPAGDLMGAVSRRRPIIEGTNEDERGYLRTRPCKHARRIERNPGTEPHVV